MAQLSDKAIVAKAREYSDLKAELLAALQARVKAGKGTVVEGEGVKVAMRTNVIKTWDVKGLAAKLTRTVAAKVITRKVDARALARAIKAGDVSQADVDAAILATTESAPFLEVTVR